MKKELTLSHGFWGVRLGCLSVVGGKAWRNTLPEPPSLLLALLWCEQPPPQALSTMNQAVCSSMPNPVTYFHQLGSTASPDSATR